MADKPAPPSSGATTLGKPITPPNFKKQTRGAVAPRPGTSNSRGATGRTASGAPQGRNMQEMIKRLATKRLNSG